VSATGPLVRQATNDSGNAWILGTTFFLFSALCWGMNVPMMTRLFATWDPYFLSPLRVLIASMALALLVVLTGGVRELAWSIRPGRAFLLALPLAVFFFFYALGLQFSNPITAAAIMAGSPVYAALTLRLLTGARLERGFVPAAALTGIGAWIAVQGRPALAGASFGVGGGELLMLLALIAWNIYSIGAQRWFPPDTSQLRRTYVVTLAALPWLLVAWLCAWGSGIAGAPRLDPGAEAIILLLVTAVFATGLASYTWNLGVERAGLAAGSLWQNMVPIFAVLVSMLYGIFPTIQQVIGGAIVLCGVLYMQWRRIRQGM
jgi:drug/metabolite transporter (DMT)-like permease